MVTQKELAGYIARKLSGRGLEADTMSVDEMLNAVEFDVSIGSGVRMACSKIGDDNFKRFVRMVAKA